MWKKIKGFPQYSVSILGEIRNDRQELPRQVSRTQQGSAKVTLYRDGRPYTKSLALIVAQAHVWNDHDPEIFNTPIHLNNDLMDNRAANLEWRPRWFAKKFQQQYFTPEFRFATTAILDKETGRSYTGFVDICQTFGVLYVDVLRSCTHGGYVFPTWKEFEFDQRE